MLLSRKNYLEVRIFFEEMNIDITEQKPAYESGDLLGKKFRLPVINTNLVVENMFIFILSLKGKGKEVDQFGTMEIRAYCL